MVKTSYTESFLIRMTQSEGGKLHLELCSCVVGICNIF